MNTSLKMITAALTAAVLAAPLMVGTASAETQRHPHERATTSAPRGDAHGAPTRPGPDAGNGAVLDDCVHVTFPQCSGS
jgi:hypothetical protein